MLKSTVSANRCPICGKTELKLDDPHGHRRNYLQKYCSRCESWVIPELENYEQLKFKLEEE